jgi:hypothetical protein
MPATHRQFDFWIGEWEIEQEFPQPDGTVIRLPARATVTRELDGCALLERWRGRVQFFWEGMTMPDSLLGLSMRAFDDVDGVWRIHWMDTRGPRRWTDGGFSGGFANGVGTFLSAPGSDGVRRRIRFYDIDAAALSWDLAVTTPAGDWLVLWRMRFRRN